jgi:hypothetical protein
MRQSIYLYWNYLFSSLTRFRTLLIAISEFYSDRWKISHTNLLSDCKRYPPNFRPLFLNLLKQASCNDSCQ